MFRVVIAAVAFLCIATGALQPFYWMMFTANRAGMRDWLIELPYRQ